MPLHGHIDSAMKYGILFSIVSVLLTVASVLYGGWYSLCLWPAVSFGMVAAGYLFAGPRVYGKSESGILSFFSVILLLPFLVYLWCVWYGVRLVKTESAYNQLTDNIYIGRRLLAREFPEFIDHVIDLTCEFTEPKPLRNADYHAMQILDGYVPNSQQFKTWIAKAATLDGKIYIHCAEGHARTGLFAAALLVRLGYSQSAEDALKLVNSKRPQVRLGSHQLQALTSACNPSA